MRKGLISWIVSQDGETMVIVILLIAVSSLSGIVYRLNTKLTDCSNSKFTMQVEMAKKMEDASKQQAEKYIERIKQLEDIYNAKIEEKTGEVKSLRSSVNKTIKTVEDEINK